MPPRLAAGRGAGGRSLSPTKGTASTKAAPKKREAKIDPKEEAERLEKERQVARNALLLQVQGILTRVSDGGENEVDVDFTSIVEDACNEVLKWLKSPIGDSASKNEYGKRLPEVEEARALAVAKTKEKRAEPPLPYNIFHRDEIIITGDGRQLEAAVKGGDVDEVRRLLASQRGRALITNVDPRGWTPLHYAVTQGDHDIAQELIRAGAEVNTQAEDGTSCMHLACAAGRDHMIEVLLQAGAVTDLEANDTLWTPLHVACSIGSIAAGRRLLDAKADANALAKGGWRPLHCAAMNGHTDLAAILMLPRGVKGESLADPTQRLDLLNGDGTEKVPGLTAAQVAKAHGHYECDEKIRATAMFVLQEAEAEARAKEAAKQAAEDEKNKKITKGKGRSKSPAKTLALT